MKSLTPKSHAEAVAVFRHGVIGALTQAQMDRGQLASALESLAQQRFVPPGAKASHCYSAATLERWYYAYKKRGLSGLAPRGRSDKGRAQQLSAAQRELLLDIRREYPSASVTLILRTLVTDGRLEKDAVSATTVRRLFAEAGLDRVGMRDGSGTKTRLRWQAERPMALWHADVCHGPGLTVGGKSLPLRIHALLDDASRYVVALEAHHTEREVDMLGLMVRALRKHGPPDALYLDNGATYRGETLATACARIGTSLLHARPYDAPARGKMERFWRTLREGCLDFLGPVASLHDVNVRLCAFLDAHYHVTSHAALMGATPKTVFEATPRAPDGFDEAKLREALTTRIRRRVRRDTTVAVDGADYELDAGHLAGRLVHLCRCLVDQGEAPWAEFEGKRYTLHPVDAVKNARRKRPLRRPPVHDETYRPHPAFDPPRALLDRAVGRPPRHRDAGES
ncbi:DDE-type integrase/transposase/recombinase [Myxococcus xanthus]|uniref:DDE-type integrase/transposase/recombinase n=1 Tax=Myxococcus xanthus TaxID=34 RepID=UPI001EFFCFE6|nr:DDE-type integrase/transposase/recombinase [Myxococcus xanthus]